MKQKFVDAHMAAAEVYSQLSSAKRLQVGCVVVKNNTIIGKKTKPEALHAETNALAKIARSTNSSEGAVLFVTHAPCLDCAKLIYQSGISGVFYRNSYRDEDGINFLKKCNLEVKKC